MPKPAHMSNSQLASWLHCGKSYQLKRILGAPAKPAVWLVAGTAIHETIHRINLAHVGEIDEVDPVTEFEKHFDIEVGKTVANTGLPASQWKTAGRATRDKPNKEDTTWWRTEGARQCKEYTSWLSASGWTLMQHADKIMAEFETTTEFGGFPVKGFLDAVMVTPDGELRVVDYKTGNKPSAPVQLGLYAAALKRLLDMDILAGNYFMTRKGEMTDDYDLTRFTPSYFDNIFAQAKKAMDADIFIPNPGNACFMCDVSDYCHANGGVYAWQMDPDHPQYTTDNQEV